MPSTWKRTFYILWTGQFISLISSSAINFALIIWLSIETKSAEVLAFAAIAALLPQSIIGPVAGVFVDRWNRKWTMILADAFIALCTLAMAILFYTGNFELLSIYLLLGLRSVGAAFHMPAMQASVPLLAPEDQLLRISGVNQVIHSTSSIAGPALGALAIGLMDIGAVLLLDVVGAVVAIITLFVIHIPNPAKTEDSSPKITPLRKVSAELSSGLSIIYQDKGIRLLFIVSVLVTFCLMPLAVMFPLLTLEHFGGGKYEMSLIEIVWGIGMLIGGGLLSVYKPTLNKVILINYMYLLLGLTLALSGVLPSKGFLLFVALTILGGLSASVYSACFTALIQEKIKASLLGRVFSIYYSIAILPSLIGLLGTGFLADFIGLRWTFIILGSCIVVLGILAFTFRDLLVLGRKTTIEMSNSADLDA